MFHIFELKFERNFTFQIFFRVQRFVFDLAAFNLVSAESIVKNARRINYIKPHTSCFEHFCYSFVFVTRG